MVVKSKLIHICSPKERDPHSGCCGACVSTADECLCRSIAEFEAEKGMTVATIKCRRCGSNSDIMATEEVIEKINKGEIKDGDYSPDPSLCDKCEVKTQNAEVLKDPDELKNKPSVSLGISRKSGGIFKNDHGERFIVDCLKCGNLLTIRMILFEEGENYIKTLERRKINHVDLNDWVWECKNCGYEIMSLRLHKVDKEDGDENLKKLKKQLEKNNGIL